MTIKCERDPIRFGATQVDLSVNQTLTEKINNGTLTPAEIANIKERSFEKHLPLLQKAIRQRVGIVLLQEACLNPFVYVREGDGTTEDRKIFREFGELIDGCYVRKLQKIAHDGSMAIVASIHEAAPEKPKDYNTAVVIDCEGNIVGKYRKTMIPDNDGFHEDHYFAVGDLGLPVFDVKTRQGEIKVGVYICHDRHNYQGFERLVMSGAEVIFEPSATVAGTSLPMWDATGMADAFHGNVVVVKSNRHGVEGIGKFSDGRYYGRTLIAGPDGIILAQASEDKDELVVAEIDVDAARKNGQDRYPKKRHEFLSDEARSNLLRVPPQQRVIPCD